MSETILVYQETHDGWTARQSITGEWEIVDQSGWTLATIHYDHRFTCNATNHHRAELLSKAPETAAELSALRAQEMELREALVEARDELTEPIKQSESWRALVAAIDAAHEKSRWVK